MAPISLIPDVLLFTVGRAPCVAPLAIVLHEYTSGIEALDAQMQRCPRPRPTCPPGCHTSFHFGVGGNCNFHQYVDLANTAWGFAVTPATCPEPLCPPDPCESCTGLTVDQYNPDLLGNPPVLPAFLADACGTANSCVIHVAVNSLFPTNQSLGDGPCCAPNADAYKCLVQSLCYIFDTAGLVPTQSTLLVHCEELICLDIDQLVIDILACLAIVPPPLPPCNCTADVSVVALDTVTVNMTVVEAPVNTFTVSADVIISPDVGNNLTALPNGLFVGEGVPDAPVCADQAHLPLVLGNSGAGGAAVWGKPRRPAMAMESVADGEVINPSTGSDLYLLIGGGAGNVELLPPVGCEKTDLWIKNLSAFAFTVESADQIDGVDPITLEGTTAGTYPFGNNGGEAVHLIWDPIATTWYIV